MSGFEEFLQRRDGSTELIVLLHGFRNRSDRLKDVREVIQAQYPHADIYAPELDIASIWRCTPAEDQVAQVTEAIDQIYASRAGTRPYQSMTLIGHSIGAVFARKISIVAHGEQRNDDGEVVAPFEPRLAKFTHASTWASSIRRIVLLAGMNRGWSVDSGKDWYASVLLGMGQFIGELFGGKLTIFSIRRGAPFLVQTRLQWLALMNPHFGRRPDVTIVQLLGSIDDQVAPDDSIDFSIDDVNNSGAVASYNYLEVRHSGHDNIVEMSASGDSATQVARDARRAQFMFALSATPDQLMQRRINRAQMEDTLPPSPDPAVRNMVFVVHGIRDKGFWTKKLARTIKAQAGAERFESWTQGYGYFAMLPFLFHSVRQRKVEWLMDCYCEARARYPNATFHYFGHSNGTYLVTKALDDYPAARFGRIVLTGSVVRRNYKWKSLIDTKRVDSVLNYVATRDWVVAIFPKGLQCLRYFNLGSAGHDGFDDPAVHQVNFIDGSHGVGHEEGAWDDIARFVVHGTVPELHYPPFKQQQSKVWQVLGKASPVLLVGLLALVAAGAYGLSYWAGKAATPAMGAVVALAFVGYFLLLRLVVTRF